MYSYSSGAIYSGECKDGKMNGKGIYYYINGEKY